MNTKVSIVVIGNVVREMIFFPDKMIGPVLGSPCAYSSITMSKLGRSVGVVSYLGNDLEKDMIEQFRNVDTTGFLTYKYTMENNLIYHKDGRKSLEYARVTPVIEFEDISNEYLEADIFYICPMDYEVSIEVCEKLHDMGKMVITDLGGFGGTTSFNHFTIDTRRGQNLVNNICKFSSIVKASEEDMKYIIPHMRPDEVSNYFIEKGAKATLITLGEKGALCQVAGQSVKYIDIFQPECEESELNLVGAGDAFVAGMIACIDGLENIEEAAVYGSAVASFIIEKAGGCQEDRMPTSFTVAHRLKKQREH